MNRNDNIKGWVAFAVFVLAMGVVGWMEEAEARNVVCVPIIETPAPATGPARDVKATFSL